MKAENERPADALIDRWAVSYLKETSDMVFLKNRDLVYIGASLPFARMVGRKSVEELIGLTDFDIFADQKLARNYVEDDLRMIESGRPLEPYVEPIPEQNGKPAWVRTRKDFIFGADGEIAGVYGVSVDVTEKMELEQDRQRLSDVVIDSDICAFECDLRTDTLYNVKYASVIEGLEPVMAGFPDTFIEKYVHPDSAAEYRRLYSEMKRGLPLAQGKVKYIFGGEETLMFVHMRNSFGADGRPLRVFGTAQKLSMLTELEKQYHVTLEQHGIFSWVIDVKNRIFTASDLTRSDYSQYLSLTSDNASSLSIAWGVHPDDCSILKNAYWRVHAGEQKLRERVRRRNQATQDWDWYAVCFDGVYDGDGTLSRIYASAVNINRQVESEERYAEFQSYQRMTMKNVIASVRLNLTQNTCFRSHTKDEGDMAEEFYHSVDEFWEYANQFISDDEKRQELSARLNRPALLAAFAKGATMQECEMQYDFRSSGRRWVRSVVEMMENPYTHDIEALVYSMDIDQQHTLMQIVDRVVGMDYELLGIISLDTEMVQFYKQSPIEREHEVARFIHYPTIYVKFLKELISPEELPQMVEANSLDVIKRELEKQELYSTSAKMTVDGRTAIKKWTYSYLDGQRTNIVYTRTDVTDVVQSRQKEQEVLERALIQAKRANNAKTEFLSRMSHDIRTPMNAIINLTELAADDVADRGKLLSDLDKIKMSGNFLLGLINDILDMSRIESGKMMLTPKVYRLEHFEGYLDSVLAPLFASKNIRFTLTPSDLVPALYVDEVRFNQIFFNVLSNAAKYTPAGGSVTMKAHAVPRGDGMVYMEFVITDTGIGMNEEFLKKAFAPFERESAVSAYTGTGLGLSITKAIVEAFGGKIELQSKQGCGTTVKITMTLSVPEISDLGGVNASAAPRGALGNTASSEGRILVAEDHPLNREVITRLLQKHSFEAVCVENGKEALEAVKNSKKGRYRLVLMDVRMPVMDGIAATKAIRGLPDAELASIPIVAMTADAFLEDRTRCLEAGMDGYLSKPVNVAEMIALLDKILDAAPKR